MAANYDQTPKWGVARIVGVACEARQSSVAHRRKGLRRERGRPSLTRATRVGRGDGHDPVGGFGQLGEAVRQACAEQDEVSG